MNKLHLSAEAQNDLAEIKAYIKIKLALQKRNSYTGYIILPKTTLGETRKFQVV